MEMNVRKGYLITFFFGFGYGSVELVVELLLKMKSDTFVRKMHLTNLNYDVIIACEFSFVTIYSTSQI